MKRSDRVLAAMSGGVDSSAAAALLKKQGYEVVGAGMRLSAEEDDGPAGTKRMGEAKLVADKIGIPFFVLDYEEAFQKEVVDYFASAYLQGKTPNPCVVCNQKFKFGRLLELAGSMDISFVATGHYARIGRDPETGKYLLKRGLDPEKDQSCFLYSLSQAQLACILFPLGEMRKRETRRIARSLDLPVWERQPRAAPGQSAVFYREDVVLGGGTIVK